MNTKNNYGTMKASELVQCFNDAVAQLHELGRGEAFKPVSRFADTATGVKRCEAIEEALAIARENPNPDGALKKKPANPVPAPKINDEAKPKEADMSEAAKKKATGKKAGATPPAAKKAKPAKGEKTRYNDGPFWMNRPGSNREKAVKRLLKNEGEMIKRSSVITAIYGSEAAASGEYVGTTDMVLKGIAADIVKHKIGYELRREKPEGEKEMTVGLFKKKG